MILKRTQSIAASALLLVGGVFGHAEVAHAGNVSTAQLSCYVDTYAYDYPDIGECHGVWNPGTASNPSQAVFQVVGLTAGSYTFYWTDLSTGRWVSAPPATSAVYVRSGSAAARACVSP